MERLYRGELGRLNTEPTGRLYPILYGIGHRALRILTSSPEVVGAERIPRSGPAIVTPNHLSQIDPVLLAEFLVRCGRWPAFLAKSGLFESKLLGWLMRDTGQIPVYRDSAMAPDSLVAARESLAMGRLVVIYPEGTITFDPDEWPMRAKTGAARLALETGAPVIPIGQWGANYALPARKRHPFRLRRHAIAYRIGEPVDLSGLESMPGRARLAANRITRVTTQLVAQARGIEAPHDTWDHAVKRRVVLPTD